MAHYRMKPVVVEAFQYNGDLINSDGEYYVPEWAEQAHKSGHIYFDEYNGVPGEMFVRTLDGDFLVHIGDYVALEAGEMKTYLEDVFDEMYIEVEE